jgi:2-polyprenyl-3-methyl-5-hydroxy-6-metoxy-1,4-benzoquinol methylase
VLPYFGLLYFGLSTIGLAGAAVAFSLRVIVDFALLANLSGILQRSLLMLIAPALLLAAAFLISTQSNPGQAEWFLLVVIHLLGTMTWSWRKAPATLRESALSGLRSIARRLANIKSMDRNMNTTETLNEPWKKPWPPNGIEAVTHCPVCGDVNRETVHSDLIDNVFRIAPGKWTLWQCANCRSAYMNPRPTPDTIHLAYANYYTHQQVDGKEDYASLCFFRKLRRRLINGYTNWRYSTANQQANALGVLAAFAIPTLKRALDRRYRHMPKRPKGGGRLLDVGCGDGSFLSLAKTCGWDVVGLDPDPKAVANASMRGLIVHEGGIEYYQGTKELFDVITLNHVIEHVYEPVSVLKTCHALLKPGGQLWVETPNIESFGHERFGRNWRGLETPRHLLLFNRRSLGQAFIDAGFSAPKDRARPSPCRRMFRKSFSIEIGRSPNEIILFPRSLQLLAVITSIKETFLSSRKEFLTLTARKK